MKSKEKMLIISRLIRVWRPEFSLIYGLGSTSGSLAMLAAMRRASYG